VNVILRQWMMLTFHCDGESTSSLVVVVVHGRVRDAVVTNGKQDWRHERRDDRHDRLKSRIIDRGWYTPFDMANTLVGGCLRFDAARTHDHRRSHVCKSIIITYSFYSPTLPLTSSFLLEYSSEYLNKHSSTR